MNAMDAAVCKIAHYNYSGIFSLVALGILGFPITEEVLLILLGRIIPRDYALRLCGGHCATVDPSRPSLEAYEASVTPAHLGH
jgi:hypothetical protein